MDGEQDFRAWIWHVNETGGTLHFHLSAYSTEDVDVTNIKSSHGVVPLQNLRVLGLCLAKTQVRYFDYDSIDEEGFTIDADTERTIFSVEVPHDRLLGAIVEFHLDFSSSATLVLRSTFCETNAPYGSPTDPMTDLVGTSPRGW